MATITVTLAKDCFIAGAKQTAGSSITVERSLAGELITNGIAIKPASWESSTSGGSEVFAQQDPVTGGIAGFNGPAGSLVPFQIPAAAKFALVGDSRTWGNHQSPSTASPSSIVRAGGVVTCTFGGNHGLANGQKIAVYNVQSADGSQDFSIYVPVEITRISATVFTYPDSRADATGAFGTSYSGGRSSAIHVMEWRNSGAWWSYFTGLMGGGLKLSGEYGWGGALCVDWLANPDLIKAIGLTDATDVFLDIGINDVVSSAPVYTASTIASNVQTLAKWFVAYGKRVWLSSIDPLGSGYSTPIPKNAKIIEVNRRNRAFCVSQPNIRYVDTYAGMIDPMNATAGSALANSQVDNIHQSGYGARLKAKKMYAQMSPFLSAPDPKIQSNADTYNVDTNSGNVLDAVLFSNATGGSTTGSTGNVTGMNVATGLTMVVTGAGAACTGGVSARSDGFGYDQTFIFTPSANNDCLQVKVAVTSPTTRISISDILEAFGEVSVSGVSGSNLKGVFADLDIYDGSVHQHSYSLNLNASAAAHGTDDYTFTAHCPPIKAFSNVIVSISFYFYFAGAGTALAGKVGRISMPKNQS